MRRSHISTLVGVLSFVALCLFARWAGAATGDKYTYQAIADGGHTYPVEATAASAYADRAAYCSASSTGAICGGVAQCSVPGSCTFTSNGCTGTVTAPACTMTWSQHASPFGSGAVGGTVTVVTVPGAAPTCPVAGTETFVGGSGSVPGQSCVAGCLYNTPAANTVIKCTKTGVCTSGNTIYESTSAGQACGATADSLNVSTTATQADCDPSGTICAGGFGTNCGTYNGDEVCVSSVRKGSCVAYASGGTACAPATGSTDATPPAPNNGTPGVSATPDAAVTADGLTVNYYSSSTVASSSHVPVVTTPVQPLPTGTQGVASGTGGTTTVTGTVVATGTAGGPVSTSNANGTANGDCNAAAGVNCSSSGDAQVPSLTRSDSVQSLGDTFVAGIQGSPIYTAVSGMATSFPDTGTCPTETFSAFGNSYDLLASGCTMWTGTISPVLSVIMTAVWAIIGVMIVLTA